VAANGHCQRIWRCRLPSFLEQLADTHANSNCGRYANPNSDPNWYTDADRNSHANRNSHTDAHSHADPKWHADAHTNSDPDSYANWHRDADRNSHAGAAGSSYSSTSLRRLLPSFQIDPTIPPD